MRKRDLLWIGLLLIGTGIVLVTLAWAGAEQPRAEGVVVDRPVGSVEESLVPTPTPGAASVAPTEPLEQRSPIATVEPRRRPTSVGSAEGEGTLWRGRRRWGVGVAIGPISRYNTDPLRLGWYLDWGTQVDAPRPDGVEYVQMVRLRDGVLEPDPETIASIAEANPGSLWLVGNEPDVRWQDNVGPATYARIYHQVYDVIKAADPGAEVAMGGIAQPTPLRLRYLDMVLAAYQEQFDTEMPVDVWNVHNFVLREERDSWGVDIPPGLPDDQGQLYEIDDCDDLEIFREQIVGFRRWMAERGYRNKPLVVSEYGIPMPESYGFSPERVVAFLTGSFDFFLTAVDPALGYPPDGNRLVQRWCWYSLDTSDGYYPNGRLFDPQTQRMTPVGDGWADYVADKP